jgi:hypothetical protein
MLDVLIDALVDSLKLLPFLFITYLLMELIEHKTKEKTKETIKKSGKLGPVIGSLLGAFPQCGFSVSATNLYAARVITLGTLIAVYLSTSDEMLPIFLSEAVPFDVIIKIFAIKLLVGMIAGLVIDFILRILKKSKGIEDEQIEDLCEKDNCHCEISIIKSSIHHTINIFIYILIVTILINIFIYVIGEDTIATFIQNSGIFGPVITGFIGLIPNCAASVIITQLYIQNVIPFASMISGLLVGAGVGIAVLFRTNKGIKNNIKIVVLLYVIGVVVGVILDMMGIVINV